jgi:hypothetical protein
VAARDADYGAFTWWPRLPGLDQWLDLYHRVARSNGAEPDAGRRLLAWAHAAGFTDVTAGASAWCFASPADRDWWSQSWAGRATSSDFAVQARDRGLATDADLGRIAEAWREWGAHPDGWLVWCTARCSQPADLHAPGGRVLASTPQGERIKAAPVRRCSQRDTGGPTGRDGRDAGCGRRPGSAFPSGCAERCAGSRTWTSSGCVSTGGPCSARSCGRRTGAGCCRPVVTCCAQTATPATGRPSPTPSPRSGAPRVARSS